MSDGDPCFVLLVSSVWTQTLDSSPKATSLHLLSCKSEPACSWWTKLHPSRDLTMTGLTSLSGFYQTLEPYGYPCILSPSFRRLVQMALHVAWFHQDLSQKCSVESNWVPSGPKLNLEYYSCVYLVAQAGFELGLLNLGVLPSRI